MHELSIAHSLIQSAEEAAQKAGAKRVTTVHLALGKLAGVVPEALLFSYDIAAQDTLLEGSKLVIEEIPVTIYCAQCDKEITLPGIQSFRCPTCNTPSPHIRHGKELELVSLEIETE